MKSRLFLAGTALLLSASAAFAAFSDVDADGDGAITAVEFTTAFPDLESGSFVAADANADGVITEDEHVAAVDAGILPAD
ncbi:MAG: EF-hand domain-containing protein [Pseudomonadota bacterium]